MKNENFEIVKQVIVNEQNGCPNKLRLVIEEQSLSDRDKERIKQAVLESATKNTDYSPKELAGSLCQAFTLIQTYTSPTLE